MVPLIVDPTEKVLFTNNLEGTSMDFWSSSTSLFARYFPSVNILCLVCMCVFMNDGPLPTGLVMRGSYCLIYSTNTNPS